MVSMFQAAMLKILTKHLPLAVQKAGVKAIVFIAIAPRNHVDST